MDTLKQRGYVQLLFWYVESIRGSVNKEENRCSVPDWFHFRRHCLQAGPSFPRFGGFMAPEPRPEHKILYGTIQELPMNLGSSRHAKHERAMLPGTPKAKLRTGHLLLHSIDIRMGQSDRQRRSLRLNHYSFLLLQVPQRPTDANCRATVPA